MSLPVDSIEKAVGMLRQAQHAIVLTGAGCSTSSGIPDFRSARTGLWTKDDPMKVASLTTFHSHPERFYNWLRPLARKMLAAQPNAAHLALAQLEQSGVIKAIITQNIDGLHQRAGSKNVIEVHGSITYFICIFCGLRRRLEDFASHFLNDAQIPRCPNCERVVKPDIVLFEEMLPVDAWEQAEYHASHADLCLVVGSSLEVYPAAGLPLYTIENGGKLMINTFSPTPLDSHAHLLLPADICEVIPALAGGLR
jgi:NAD-dependent deacetylase